ncbi:hypothetical protein FQZ97_538730 [compost metagenome]
MFQGGGGLGQARQFQPAGQVIFTTALQLLERQAGGQCPDGFVVGVGRVAAQQRGNEHALAGGGEVLAVGLQGAGAYELGSNLLVHRQFGQAFQARMAEGLEGALGLVAGHGQFGGKGAGENLLGGLQALQRDLLQDARRAADILLLVGEIGGGQAQQGRFFRLGFAGLLQQLLDAGLRGAGQFAEAGRGRAGAGNQQAGEAEGGERTQASDHLSVPILVERKTRLYPRPGWGAMSVL